MHSCQNADSICFVFSFLLVFAVCGEGAALAASSWKVSQRLRFIFHTYCLKFSVDRYGGTYNALYLPGNQITKRSRPIMYMDFKLPFVVVFFLLFSVITNESMQKS